MTLELIQTKSFKKSLKKYKHNKKVLDELYHIVELLIEEKPIPTRYKDHGLVGNHKGIRELHLKPDDLLLYIHKAKQSITLLAMGSHSDLF